LTEHDPEVGAAATRRHSELDRTRLDKSSQGGNPIVWWAGERMRERVAAAVELGRDGGPHGVGAAGPGHGVDVIAANDWCAEWSASVAQAEGEGMRNGVVRSVGA